ncbi:type VI secretion protein [Streptomyces sp. NPDC092952]|uniref:type VI secretion protein n=1 Tax=Streptomyces sp. NPDC092952 TaxID=3366018 RepID=UPI00380D4D70
MAGRPHERTGGPGRHDHGRTGPGNTGHERPGGSGGIPDGLLIGLLVFLLGLALLAWTTTGLAGLFAHGAWPEGVTLTETPRAMRSLVSAPHDLPAAWPDTPAGELSGYGLFWGLFIGELLVLLVLTVFVLGTVARWRAVRTRQRTERNAYGHEEKDAREELNRPGHETRPSPHSPSSDTVLNSLDPHTPAPPRQRRPPQEQPPLPDPATPVEQPPAPSPTPLVVYGPPPTRRPTVVRAVHEAPGPALVVTSDPTVWDETKDARAKLGPVLLYDPGHLCDTPARLHWSPTTGCESPETAAARATALLAPVRPQARIDAATADTAETLLRCWLHAAAVDGRPFRQVHRWAQGSSAHEPVRLLRTHPKAASGLAGLLESALTAHPERREMAQELTARAFAALSTVHIREACTPNRADSLVLESFVAEGGTLYVVGEPIEDPRSGPGAMPLLTALAAQVIEHGRGLAARSPEGRLDPPLTLVLDDIAAVAPVPRLPELLATGPAIGLPPLALLRSREQGRARWPQELTPAP